MKTKEGRFKKMLAGMLSITMAFTLCCINMQVANASETTIPSWLTARQSDEDIILSVTDNATYSISGIASALGAQADTSGSNTSIKTTNINVTDLSNWYVYDRYDTSVYADQAAYLAGTGYNEALRPYFGDSDSSVETAWPSSLGTQGEADYVDLTDKNNWTIVNAKRANEVQSTYGVAARHLKEHISAGVDSTGAANIYWYGYSQTQGTDWAFYPAAAGGKKTVDYKVDASKIYFHTVPQSAGTGFLINTKIVDGKLYGYAVMTNYTSSGSYPSGISGFTIYKYEGVDLTQAHNSSLTSKATSIIQSSANFSACTTANGYDQIQMHMEITDTHLYMTITPIGTSAAQNATPVVAFDEDLNDLSAGGFGPIVSYSSHACGTTSAVDFTDLKMKLSESDSTLNGYANADYTQFDDNGDLSKKYYVLLGNNTNTAESGYVDFFDLTGDRAFLELLKKENVVLVTNLETAPVNVEEGKNGTRCNLADYLGEDNVVQVDLSTATTDEEIAEIIYNAINNAHYNTTSSQAATNALDNQATPTGTNVYVVEKNTGVQVDTISTGNSTFTEAYLEVNTDLSTDNAEGIVVTVLDPEGNALEAPDENNTNKATYDPDTKTIRVPVTALPGTYNISVKDTLTDTVTQTVASATSFSVTKNIGVTFNGVTSQSGLAMDGCSTTNSLGAGILDTSLGDYTFVVNLDGDQTALSMYSVTWGPNGTENTLTEGSDYNVTKIGNKYTFTIDAGALASIQDNININAVCSNVFDEMDNAEIEDASGLGNGNVITTCSSGEDFVGYVNVNTNYYKNLTADQLEVYSDDTLLEYQTDYSYNETTGKVKIFGDVIGSSLTFRGEPTPVNLSVTFKEALNIEYSGEAIADFDHDYTAQITPAHHYYVKEIIVKSDCAGHETLVSPDDYTFDGTTLTIKKNHVWGNIVVRAIADTTYYTVTNNVSHLTVERNNVQVTEPQDVKYSTVYTETLVAPSGYYLPESITLTRGEDTLVLGTDYSYDPQTGEITIEAEAISADIVVNAQAIPDLSVTTQLTGLTFDGEATVKQQTEYTGTFALAGDYYRLPTAIEVFAGDQLLVANEDYTYNATTGALVVNADAVTDNLNIIASGDDSNIIDAMDHSVLTKTDKTTLAHVYQEDTTTYLYVVADENYNLPTQEQLKVYYDGVLLSALADEYSYNPNTGKLSIWSDTLTDKSKMLTVTAEQNAASFDVTFNGTHVTSDGAATATFNTDYTATLTAQDGYRLTDSITVKVGNDTLTAADEYTYNASTGEIVINGAEITDDVTITATATLKTYNVTLDAENVTITGSDEATHGQAYTATLEAADGYSLPETIEVKVGESVLAAEDYTYNKETGEVEILANKVTGNITITAAADINVYDVTFDAENVTITGSDEATHGQDYTATLEAADGYLLPETIEVKVGENVLAAEDYTYDKETGEVVIDGAQVTNDITITVNGTIKQYNVTLDENNITIAGNEIVNHGQEYVATIEADEGYSLPDKVKVKVGNTTLSDQDYTYNKETGEITIHADKVVGDITITKVETTQESTDTSETTPTISTENQTENEFALNSGLKVSQSGSVINVKWGKVSNADGYDVYAAYCGTNFKGLTKTVAKKSQATKIKKLNGKKLNLKKNYKIYVVAFQKVNGKKVILGKTIMAHIVGKKNTTYTNVKEIKVNKTSYQLKVGKSATIKAKTVLVDKTKKQLSDAHAKQFRYASTNKSVATVSAKGKITAKAKGSCSIYVYARNGYAKKLKVTVK
ncbi:Ig-like domain-containing protein [Eubacterium oxidoreducens]|uniref:Ig-like domain (Group 2) n=1 Tax=Eubacterium oxidoreducens TaxID=1732 RepID=A0A1G6C2H1_EUBOX|nr:Ig-like domain-containing protein [Eubacterium oxidoreducens]SDB27047.1 Ig-like domain (group 2) [Eubacterium oxidoreducens]